MKLTLPLLTALLLAPLAELHGSEAQEVIAITRQGKTDYTIVQSDIKLFADQGAESFFAETPDYMAASQQFIPLKFWLGYQLLVDPHQPVEPLIRTFTERSRIQKTEEGGNAPEVGEAEQHRKPLVFGTGVGKRLSDKKTITVQPADIPQDRKFHLYHVGRIRVREGTTVWALEGARLGVNVHRLFDPEAEGPAANEWDAWISLKLQGPAYVWGSKDPNGAWMDRVLLVRPQG